MAFKKFIISILVLLILALIAGYFLFSKGSPDTSSCDILNDTLNGKMYCYNNLAAEQKDSRICDLIPEIINEAQTNYQYAQEEISFAKEACKISVIYATNNSDVSQCEEFQKFGATCYFITAINAEKPKYCPKAYGVEVPNNDGEIYECLAYIAIKKDDLSICTDLDSSLGTENIIKLCKNATGKDCSSEDLVVFKGYKSEECLASHVSFSASQGKLKPSVCGAMKSEQKNWCYTILASSSKDESYCNNILIDVRSGDILNDRIRDLCIMEVAVKKGDISLCSFLEDQDYIDEYKIQNRCRKAVEDAN